MIKTRGVIDKYDLEYVLQRYPGVKFSQPAPVIWKNGKKKINPHVSRFFLKSGEIVDVFHVKPIYYATPEHEWRPLYEVASHYGNRTGLVLKEGWENKIDLGYLVWYMKRGKLIKHSGVRIGVEQGAGITPLKIPLFLNITSTFYPDPDVESTTVDGIALHISDNTAWATIRSGAGTAAVDNGATNEMGNMETGTASAWRKIHRGFALFDTGPTIGDSDVITSATLSFVGSAKSNTNSATAAQAAIHAVATTPASNTAIASSDYPNIGSTSFGSIAYADIDVGGTNYNDIALNASGIADVSKTGISKFGWRSGGDLNNSEPTINGTSLTTNVDIFFADQATQAKDPKLVVVHSSNLTVSVSDSITVSESVTMHITSFINVNDTATVTESVTVLIPQLLLSVNDTITVTENISASFVFFASVFDTITITESVTVFLPFYGVNVNEAITITESVTVLQKNYVPNVNDSITVTESITLERTAVRQGIIHMRSRQQARPLSMDDRSIL